MRDRTRDCWNYCQKRLPLHHVAFRQNGLVVFLATLRVVCDCGTYLSASYLAPGAGRSVRVRVSVRVKVRLRVRVRDNPNTN